jgi:adenylate cyclase
VDLEELERLGLYDPGAEGAAERLALLRFLREQGATVEEMVEADRQGRLPGLAGDRLLRPGGRRLTQREAAERAGVSLQMAARLGRACGLPDPGPDVPAATEADVDAFRFFAAAAELLGEEVALRWARVAGASLARIAEATMSTVSMTRDASLIARGAPDLERAQQSAANAALLPPLWATLENLLRHHLDVANNRRFELAFPRPGTDTVDLAIGFADLVDFTGLTERLSTSELGAALADFDARAADVIATRRGRLVKLIGDEVMFVAADAATGCDILVGLVEAFVADDVLPALRGGLAAGEVVARDGDYYGPAVNLAARVAKLAQPGTALVTGEVKRRVPAPSEYRFGSSGAHAVKGVTAPVDVFTVQRS